MYFSIEEEKIISGFYKNIDKVEGSTLRLCWADGSAAARFDTCFEDEDDVTGEEYNSFVFKILSVEGSVPVEISDDSLCVINYKNFPRNIMLGQKDVLQL